MARGDETAEQEGSGHVAACGAEQLEVLGAAALPRDLELRAGWELLIKSLKQDRPGQHWAPAARGTQSKADCIAVAPGVTSERPFHWGQLSHESRAVHRATGNPALHQPVPANAVRGDNSLLTTPVPQCGTSTAL